MKTLSYYKQLRDDYACIIPKTAPAYELIEALDVLIASLQPDETQPHFLGVPVNLPKGWGISCNTSSNTIVLTDHCGYRIAVAYPNIDGEYVIWWEGKYKTVLKTQQDAVRWLNDKANNDAAPQPA